MLVDATRKRVFTDGWPEGWSITETQTECGYQLHLYFDPGRSGAIPVKRLVWSTTEKGDRVLGQLARMRCLWEGIARYLNAGGDIDSLSDSVQLCGSDLPVIDPPGFYLLNTTQDVDDPRHVFIDDDAGNIIVWDERASVELMSNDEFAARLEKDDEDLTDQDEFRDGVI